MVYDMKLTDYPVSRANFITVNSCISLSLPTDSHFSFYVFTAYDTVGISTLRDSSNPPACCTSGGKFMFDLGFLPSL